MRRVWGVLSNVWVGIFLLLNLAGLAVFILLRYSAPEAYFLHPLYLSVLGAFGVNIACVLVSRFRFRMEQAGFLATHVGIVTALAGGALTHWLGEDGQMRIPEGGASSRLMVERAGGMYQAKEIRLAGPGELRESRVFDAAPPARLPAWEVPGLGLKVRALEHLARAVRRREVLRHPEGNPLVRFRLGMAAAGVEDWLEEGQGDLEIGNGLRVRLREAGAPPPTDKSISFGPGPDGRQGFLECDGKGRSAFHEAPEGEEVPCTLSPLKVRVLERARGYLEDGFAPAPKGTEEALRLLLELRGASRLLWAPWGEPVTAEVGGERIFVRFANPEKELGFQVHLEDFRKEDYEGSALPRSFESRVKVEGRTVRIRMNEPLLHRGWTFFQAAFSPPETPGGRETTVLQVSKDPGKPVVYAGALLIVGGVVFMLYLKPWMKRLGWL